MPSIISGPPYTFETVAKYILELGYFSFTNLTAFFEQEQNNI
jgi:hypothetical protein